MSLNLKKQAKAEAERARRDKATYLTELREDDPKLRELMSKFQIEFNKNWRDFDPDPILRKYPVTVGKYYRVLGVDPKLFWQRYLYRTNEEHMIKKLKRKSKSDERNHENGDSNKTPWNVGLKPTTTRDYSISPKSSPKQSVKTPWKTFKYAHTMPESAVGPKPVTPKSVKSKLKHYNSMPEQEVNTSTYRKDGKPNVGTSVKDRMKNWVDLSSSERTTSSVPEVDDQQVPALEEKQPKPKKSGGVKEWLKKKKGHHRISVETVEHKPRVEQRKSLKKAGSMRKTVEKAKQFLKQSSKKKGSKKTIIDTSSGHIPTLEKEVVTLEGVKVGNIKASFESPTDTPWSNPTKFDMSSAVAEVNRRQSLLETYEKEISISDMDEEDKREFAEFQYRFEMTFDETEQERKEILKNHPELSQFFKKKVGDTIEFWERYFWKCDADRILRKAKKEESKEALKMLGISEEATESSKTSEGSELISEKVVTIKDVFGTEAGLEEQNEANETNEVKNYRRKHPFDGHWFVEWKNRVGKDQRIKIHVKNNEYTQSGFSFSIHFEEPLHPYIPWPNSKYRQTVQDGVNLEGSPKGPKIGSRIRWTTSSPNFLELSWVRKTIEIPGQKAAQNDDLQVEDAPVKLEPFEDESGRFHVMAPSNWNMSVAEESFDVKWENMHYHRESIKISSKSVQLTMPSIDAIGDVEVVGGNLAISRNGQLVSATKREVDGILFYKFDFEISNGTRQLYQLCIFKRKVWSIEANASEENWSKRADVYHSVLESLKPTPDEIGDEEVAKHIIEGCPFDGHWAVEWSDQEGNAKKTKIHLQNNEYTQSGYQFQMIFDDLLHPHIPWPNTSHRQTIEDGVNLIEEPNGPEVGARLRWTTTSQNFSELFWIRKTVEIDGVQQTASEATLDAIKKRGKVQKCHNPLDGHWKVKWKTGNGKSKKTEIHVHKNEYEQKGVIFCLNLEDLENIFIPFPGSKHKLTAQKGVDLVGEPMGPKEGGKIRWTSTSTFFPEVFWVRQTVEATPSEKRQSWRRDSQMISSRAFQVPNEEEKLTPIAEGTKDTEDAAGQHALRKEANLIDAIKEVAKPDSRASRNPFDGKWKVKWKTERGKSKKTEIHVKNNQYTQKGLSFCLDFEIPERPYIPIPHSKHKLTIREDFDFLEEPLGPKIAGKLRWTSTSPVFPDVVWVRETVEANPAEIKQNLRRESEMLTMMKSSEEMKVVQVETEVINPFDGRWTVQWKDKEGKNKQAKIHVKENEYMQSGFPFHLNFDDPIHPFIPWPNSEHTQTVQEGVDLIDEPLGPKKGNRIRWTTTSPNFPELFWVRETVEVSSHSSNGNS